MDENIEALNHCVGYGNPSASYWFVSLEDGGGYYGGEQKNNIDPKCIEKELQRLEVYKKKFADSNFSAYCLSNEDFDNFYSNFPEDRIKAGTDFTYQNYCDIYNRLNNDNLFPENIGDSNSKIFVSNLFLISRSNSKNNFDPFVKEFIFDGTFEEWEEKYWTKRKEYISDLFKIVMARNNFITILFLGIDYRFNELLNEITGKEIKLEFEKKLIFNKLKILQTYHAGRRTTYNKKFNIDSVIKLLMN